jgi:extradiol dioxygenase family protein
LAERVQAAGVKFIIEPHIRFKGQPGEQVVFLSFGLLCFLQVCFLIRKVEV